MKKVKLKLFSSAIAAFCGFLLLASSGCVKQDASKAESVKNPSAATSLPENTEIAAAQKIIENKPDAAIGYNTLAVAYIRRARETGDFGLNTNAQTAVNRALEIEPRNYDAQRLKASLLLTFHQFEEALSLGMQLQKDHLQDPFVYGVLTDANIELGNYKEAVDAVQKMVDLRPNMESYARVALVRSLHGDSDGAIEAMSLAARIADPRDAEAQAWCLTHLGNEYLKVGRYEEGEKQYDAALKLLPRYHLALAGKGRARAAQNDYDAATKFLTDANNQVPNAENAILLGDIYTKQGNAEKAKQHYDLVEVIEDKLGAAGSQKNLALFWADRDEKLDDALAIAQREFDARKDIYTADALAWTSYKKGRLSEAKTAIDAAMRLKTKDARILYHAGMIEKDSGNRKEAKRLLETALKLNPSFDLLQAETARKVLQELS
jgi:tetratricopeptide (TPR) repeat protein